MKTINLFTVKFQILFLAMDDKYFSNSRKYFVKILVRYEGDIGYAFKLEPLYI